ncbi:MAG: lysophospholipid acyltransferase family protein [Candidatus Omnitrophota bacterium]
MISYSFYRFAEVLALSLPLNLAYSVAILISATYYIFAFKDRKIVTQNLRAIFPKKTKREISSIRLRVFLNFAKYLVDFLRFKKIDMNYIKSKVTLKGIENIKEGLKAGKGVILLTAHLGNWELGGVVLSQLGYPLLSVALPHKSKKVDEFFNEKRQSKGIDIFPLGRAAKACLRALKENRLIALVGDRDFTDKGRPVYFFGKIALFPEGAAVLSLQRGSLIIPGFMLRNRDDSYDLIFEKPLEFTLGVSRRQDIDSIISKCAKVFEKYIYKYPDQWYMFRRFWRE